MVPNRNAPKLAAAVCVISWASGPCLGVKWGALGWLWLLGWEWRGWEGGFRCKPAGTSLPMGKGWGSVPRTPGMGQLLLLSPGSREDPPLHPPWGPAGTAQPGPLLARCCHPPEGSALGICGTPRFYWGVGAGGARPGSSAPGLCGARRKFPFPLNANPGPGAGEAAGRLRGTARDGAGGAWHRSVSPSPSPSRCSGGGQPEPATKRGAPAAPSQHRRGPRRSLGGSKCSGEGSGVVGSLRWSQLQLSLRASGVSPCPAGAEIFFSVWALGDDAGK